MDEDNVAIAPQGTDAPDTADIRRRMGLEGGFVGENDPYASLRWAVSPIGISASDDELRARAIVINREFTGRSDPFGRMYSGDRHGPIGAREYYDKMIGLWNDRDIDRLWTDEAREYRALKTDAERTEYAKKHWEKKWRDYGGDIYNAVVPTTEPLSARDVGRLGEFISDEDKAFMDEWYSGSDPETFRRYGEQASAEAMESVSQDPTAGNVAQMLLPQEQRSDFNADFLERMRKAVEIKKRYEDTLRDIGIRDKFEQKMADENQWATYMQIRDHLTKAESRFLDTALAAGGEARTPLGSTLTPDMERKFMELPLESQKRVAPFIKGNAWKRDTTVVGDALRGLARVTGDTVGDAVTGAAEYVRRMIVDGKEYQEGVERRGLLRMANEGRMKEWGLGAEAVIGAVSTIPYMAIASVPYVGTATMILSAGEQFEREAALAGADVSGMDMITAKLAFSTAYALVERMQAHQIFGELTDFERRQLYATAFHAINGNLAAKLAVNVGTNTIHESIEEGIQNGIQEAYVALGTGESLGRAFTEGFVQDFVGTLGTMFLTAGFGEAKNVAQYRNKPFASNDEIVRHGIMLDNVRRMTGEKGSGTEGLADVGRMLGFVSRDWRRAAASAAEAGAGAAELRKAALMKYGLDEGQALQWDAMLTEIERNIGEDKAAVQAFYGTQNALTRSEIRQAGGMVETVDEATGARTLTFKDVFGTGTFSVELNAASGIDAEYAKTDEGVRSIVNALNDSRRKSPDGGAWTDENWRALDEDRKQTYLAELRNPGLTTFKLATGETVDNRFLAALEGKMQIADNAESGDVLGVAAFHEQGHVAGRMLALAARNGDEKAKELVGKLAEKFGTAKLDSEAFDEEVFGDRFRDYLVGRFDVQDGRLVRKAGALDVAAEDETLFEQFVDWVRSLFSRADEAMRTRTRYDEFFEQAVSGDLEGAVAADEAEGTKLAEEGTKPDAQKDETPAQNEVSDKAREKAERQVADYEARLAALPESATAKRRELEKKLAKARRVLERADGADAVTYDDAGNVIPLSQRFNTANTDIRYSITAARDGIVSAAEDMERAGATREEIWKRLGAYRGVDGRWRMEANDIRWSRNGRKALTDLLSGKRKGALALGDVVSSGVVKSDPNLAALRVIVLPKKDRKTSGGWFDGRRIAISPDYLNAEDSAKELLDTLSHEVQHYLQWRDGLVNGGSDETAARMRDDLAAITAPFADALSAVNQKIDGYYRRWDLAGIRMKADEKMRRAIDEIERRYAADEIGRDEADTLSSLAYEMADAEYRRRLDALDRDGAFRTLEEQRRELERRVRPMRLTNHGVYLSLAGEVEARMVERRRNMTQVQRRAEPPWVTQERMGMPEAAQVVHSRGTVGLNETGFRGLGDTRYSVTGLFTGTAADYAERVPVLDKDGNVTGYRIDNAPSLKYIGTGEGSQVYGWGLYGSNQRGVAEGYAANNVDPDASPQKLAFNWASGERDRADTIRWVKNGIKDKAFDVPGHIAREALRILETQERIVPPKGNIYEQTFFTDRAPGDERHLLKWYEPVSEEQKQWVLDSLESLGVDDIPGLKTWEITDEEAEEDLQDLKKVIRGIVERAGRDFSGGDFYHAIAHERTPSRYEMGEKAASLFLARAGIDGIKYPVDSYGGKGVKNGDEAGWNYVSFRDDNIRVDHKWVNGVQRYSIRAGSRVTAAEDEADERHGFGRRHGMPRIVFMVADPGHTVENRAFDGDYDGAVAWQGLNTPQAPASSGDSRASIRGPSMSKMDAAVAFAARDAMTGRERSDEDYKRLLKGLGLESKMDVGTLKQIGRDTAREAWLAESGKAKEAAFRHRMKTTGNGDVNSVAAELARNAAEASGDTDFDKEAVRFAAKTSPTLRSLAQFAAAGRHVREAINQAYKLGENAGLKTGTEAQKAEEEMRRAEEAVKAEEKRVADEIEAAREKLNAEIDAEMERIEAEERAENRRKEEVAELRAENRRISSAADEAVRNKEEQIRFEEEAKLRQAIADINEKHREKLADLRADYEDKLRAYREKVAAKEAGEKAMRQMLATQMRLHANAENVQDLDRVLGVPAVELMAQISEVLFSGAKAPGQVRGSADADAKAGESGDGGEATESGAETTATGPEVRVVGTVEEASQAEAEELHDKLVRVMAIMRDFREKQKAKAEEQARKRAEREEREEAEAKPVGNDEMEAAPDEGEEDSGEAKDDSEPEVIETVDAAADPEMVRAMLNALKTESLDLNTSKDFATYVLAFVMDSVQQSLNMEFDAVFRNTDPIVKVKFRKTLIDFLRATSDALLDPTDDAAAKLVERSIGDIKDDASVAQLWRAAAGILGVIQRRGIQQSRRRIMRDIDKYLKRMAGSGRKLDPLAPDLSRRMTARAVQDARWLRRVLKLSNGGVIAEQNKLQQTIEERQTEGGDATDVQIDRAMRRMRLLEQFGGLRYMMPAEIKVAQHYIEDRFNAEAMELASQVEARKMRTAAVADALIAAADTTREALGGFDAEDGKGLGARGRRLLDSLAGGSLRQRLQHLTGDDPAARRAVDEIVRMVFEGETKHRLLEQQFKREHDAILQFAAEAGGIDQRTLLRQLDENVPDDLSRALATPEQNRRLKWGQALQLLVSLEQTASYGDNIALHHREGHADKIREAMKDRPQFQALVNKLRETYRDRRGMISEVMERVTGLPVLSPDPLFMPVKMKSAPREGLDMKVKSWTPWNAIFSPRVKNNLDFDTSADIMGMFDERSRETAKSVAFAETGLDLRSILGRKETQTAFIRARGAFFNTRLIEQVTDALNSGYTTPSNDLINVLRPLGTACTYASLSWNVVTMLKQMTSIPAWTAVLDGGYGEVFQAMTSLDRKSIEEFMGAPGFRSRYGVERGGWGTFSKIIQDAFRDPSRNYVQRFYDAGMTLVQFGDFVPSFLIGPGVYKARKAALMRQNPGMTEEAAKNQALSDAWSLVEQCQQSDLQENLPDLLRRQGVVAKQVMKFCNSPLMQVAHEVQSARMWADAARRAKAGESGAQETADKWRARFVNQIICNHLIMPAAMYAAELLVKAALGSEPPDDDEVMGRIVAQMLLGSWGKVFILGMILDKVSTGASVGAGKVTGLYNYKPNAYMSSSGSPAGIQLVEQIVTDMGRLGSDIAYTDWESIRDDSLRMFSRAARPVKYGVEATYNYGGIDRTKERSARRRKIRKEREKAEGDEQ